MLGHDPRARTTIPIDWPALEQRRVFFGHRSVGRNIVAGVRELLDTRPECRLKLVGTNDPTKVEGPAIMHAEIGENRQPRSKDADFAEVLERGFGDEQGAVAMYKYCYVDIHAHTDPEELFATYSAHVDGIAERYPTLTMLHVTIPLQSSPHGWRERLMTRLGRPTSIRLNATRLRYNELLRETYSPVGLFDLALLESSRPGGQSENVRFRGRVVPAMAPEWTHDGGHLNERGRYRVAAHLLAFLANPRTTARSGMSDTLEPT